MARQGIEFQLRTRADSSGVKKLQDEFVSLEAQFKKVKQFTADLDKVFDGGLGDADSIENLKSKFAAVEAQVRRVNEVAADIGQTIDDDLGETEGAQELKNDFESVQEKVSKVNELTDRLGKNIKGDLSDPESLEQLNKDFISLLGHVDKANDAIKKTGKSVDGDLGNSDGAKRLKKDFLGLRKAVEDVKRSVSAGIGIELGSQITRAIQSIPRQIGRQFNRGIAFNAFIEQQSVAFETLLGSAENAQQRVNELLSFSDVTPFLPEQVIKTSKVLQALTGDALSSGTGLQLVGDAAAAVGVDMESAAFWIGRLYAGLESGTPVGEATLRLVEMGLVSGNLKRQLDELARTAQGPNRAFEILQDTFGRFNGAMEKQSTTFNGLMSTMTAATTRFLASLTEDFFETFKGNLRRLLEELGFVSSEIDKKVKQPTQEALKRSSNVASAQEAQQSKQELTKLKQEAQQQIDFLSERLSNDDNREVTIGVQIKPQVLIDQGDQALEDLKQRLSEIQDPESAQAVAIESRIEQLQTALFKARNNRLFQGNNISETALAFQSEEAQTIQQAGGLQFFNRSDRSEAVNELKARKQQLQEINDELIKFENVSQEQSKAQIAQIEARLEQLTKERELVEQNNSPFFNKGGKLFEIDQEEQELLKRLSVIQSAGTINERVQTNKVTQEQALIEKTRQQAIENESERIRLTEILTENYQAQIDRLKEQVSDRKSVV